MTCRLNEFAQRLPWWPPCMLCCAPLSAAAGLIARARQSVRTPAACCRAQALVESEQPGQHAAPGASATPSCRLTCALLCTRGCAVSSSVTEVCALGAECLMADTCTTCDFIRSACVTTCMDGNHGQVSMSLRLARCTCCGESGVIYVEHARKGTLQGRADIRPWAGTMRSSVRALLRVEYHACSKADMSLYRCPADFMQCVS